jgi:hypothetical protein
MKSVKLLVALMGISLAPLASASAGVRVWNAEYETYVTVPASQESASGDRVAFSGAEDASEWIRSEWRWNDEYQMYVAAPILGEDPFQERQVYSNYYTDFVRFGEALRVAYELQQAAQEELVWRDEYADYVPRKMMKGAAPAPDIAIEEETRAFLAKAQPFPCPEVAMQADAVRVALNNK